MEKNNRLIDYIFVKEILNPRTAERGAVPVEECNTVESLIKKVVGYKEWMDLFPLPYAIRVNGHRIIDYSHKLKGGDSVLFCVCPSLEAGIGVILWGLVEALWPYIAAAAVLTSLGFSLYSYFNQPKMGDPTSRPQKSPAQSYGIEGEKNITYDGESIAVSYGTSRLGGTVLNRLIYNPSNSSSEFIKVLLGLGEGPFDWIAAATEADWPDGIYVNNEKLRIYHTYTVETKLGTSDQTAVSMFPKLYQQRYPNTEVINQCALYLKFENATYPGLNYAYCYNRYSAGKTTRTIGNDFYGQGQLSTSQYKFGSRSLLITTSASDTQSGMLIGTLSNSNYLLPWASPFSFSFWIRINNFGDMTPFINYAILGYENVVHHDWIEENFYLAIDKKGSGSYVLKFFYYGADSEHGGPYSYDILVYTKTISETADVPDNRWVHVEVSCDGAWLGIFVNGTDYTDYENIDQYYIESCTLKTAISTDNDGDPENFCRFMFGRQMEEGVNTYACPCFIDDFRFDCGACLHYSEFTPPTEAYTESDLDNPIKVAGYGTSDEYQYQIGFPTGLVHSHPKRSFPIAGWAGFYVRFYEPGTSNYVECGTDNTDEGWANSNHITTIPDPPVPTTMVSTRITGCKVGSPSWTFSFIPKCIVVSSLTDFVPFDYITDGSGNIAWIAAVGTIYGENRIYTRPVTGFEEHSDFGIGDTVTANYCGGTATVTAASEVKNEKLDFWISKRFKTTKGSVSNNESVLKSLTETKSYSLAYPNVGLCAVDIKAGSSLSQIPDINVVCSRVTKTLYRMVGDVLTSWNCTTLDNPAWATWDLLTDGFWDSGTRYGRGYGLGRHPQYLDYTSFNAWATYCAEVITAPDSSTSWRCRFNGSFSERDKTAWDCLQQILNVGRARLNFLGGVYYINIEKPPDVYPVQIFTAGNIKAGSMKTSFVEPLDKPDKYVVEYKNEDSDYKDDSEFSERSDWDSFEGVPNIQTENIRGITVKDQAKRESLFRLQLNRSLNTKAEWEANVDAIACEVGDVVGVLHGSNRLAFSGRLVSATSTSITIDREITLSSSLYDGNCQVMVRCASDDSVQTFDVTGPFDTATATFNVDGTFSPVPAQYDVFGISREVGETLYYRVDLLEHAQELDIKIKAHNYDETAYYHADYGSGAVLI